ncbi:MAG: hypothetical protein PVJ83_07575 [Gammaproteobacteria bacterium]
MLHHTHALDGSPDRRWLCMLPRFSSLPDSPTGLQFACGRLGMPSKFVLSGDGRAVEMLSVFFVVKMLQNAVAGRKYVVEFQNSWKKYCVFILLKE